ncbi:MAG: putative transporter small subunit [Pigmentiphaga sp.]|nr:putative transporter small subunit [Pigmentiphaga sp.]
MSPTLLTFYILSGPVVVAGVLFVLVRAFFREWRKARDEGRSLI